MNIKLLPAAVTVQCHLIFPRRGVLRCGCAGVAVTFNARFSPEQSGYLDQIKPPPSTHNRSPDRAISYDCDCERLTRLMPTHTAASIGAAKIV